MSESQDASQVTQLESQNNFDWKGASRGHLVQSLTKLSTRTHKGTPSLKAALQKSTGGPGGHETEHEPAVCPCSKEE